jgi:hypothetical protein
MISKRDAHIGTEEEEELKDVLAPVYDQLALKWRWWVLEMLPVKHRYQKGDMTWVTTWSANLAHPRIIPKQAVRGVKLHRSVKMRMEAEAHKGKYKPKAKLTVEPTWVD